MAHLSQITLDRLTEEELVWLDKVCGWSYDPITLRELLEEVRDNGLTLWRIEGSPAKGLVGTRLLRKRSGGIGLWLELLVGEGLLAEAHTVREAIHEVGRRAGAESLSGETTRPGLARLYERVLGVRPSATVFREDL